jgi:YD repeat-containing protein
VLGRVVGKTVDGATTTYARDRAGRLLRAVCPDAELVRGYDALGRITAEVCNGARLESFYDEAGRETARSLAGRAGLASLWDQDHRLSSQAILVDDGPEHFGDPTAAAGSRVLRSRDCTYRPDGMLTEVDDRLSGRRSLGLDGNGRISTVSAHSWSERYWRSGPASRSRSACSGRTGPDRAATPSNPPPVPGPRECPNHRRSAAG